MSARFAENNELIDILLVDDNPGDVRLTQEAIKHFHVNHRLHVAHDGVEALAFLRHVGEFAEAPRPHMILLDLNMPRMGGREFLDEVKSDPELMSIPVIVLTSSDREDDILKSYRSHANCYITKPTDVSGLHNVGEAIGHFWFSLAELPYLHAHR